MKLERYHELIGGVFDGELADGEAGELAQGLRARPEWREDLHRQLVLWELWAQAVTPERSAKAFVAAWRTRVAAEADAPEFQAAVRSRLEQEAGPHHRAAWTAVRNWWPTLRRRLDLAWMAGVAATALALVFWLAVPRSTAAVVTIRGEAVCPLCVLHQGHEHLPAIRVGHGDAAHIYYLERNAAVAGLQNRFCTGPTPVVARGTATTEDASGEHFTAETVLLPHEKPKPKDDERVIFPL
jgi:hypothetical protein